MLQSKDKIIFLKSYYDYKIWGGKQIKKYGYEGHDKIGEALIISTLENKESLIINEKYWNWKLSYFYQQNQDFFGNYNKPYPLLTKIIDANHNLSVQVHPDDKYAKKYFNKLGKDECWYIIDCPKKAKIIYGSNENDINQIAANIKKNDWSFLREVLVNVGDVIYVPAGTIHAITKGILVYEIQQSSDLTFRLYDYNRVEKNGETRELHIKDALNTIKNDQKLEVIKSFDGLIVDSPKFKLRKKTITSEDTFYIPEAKWLEFTVISGNGQVSNHNLKSGDAFLVGNKESITIKGKLTVLIGYIV